MLAVLGTFRFPPDNIAAARPLMADVIAQTLKEPGCLAYSYAQDVADPGLFHVSEQWTDRAALTAHFQTGHMIAWAKARAELGFGDRRIFLYQIGEAESL